MKTALTDNLDVDERRKLRQYEDVKGEMRDRVHRELRQRAATHTTADDEQVGALARELKHNAVHEVGVAESELARGRTVARVSQVIDYVFYVLYGLIGLQIALELLGAREGSGFKQFMNSVTAPLLAPFRGLVADPAVGSFQFMLSYVIALGVYALLHLAINGALRIVATRKTAV
jgi:hypothetical protein